MAQSSRNDYRQQHLHQNMHARQNAELEPDIQGLPTAPSGVPISGPSAAQPAKSLRCNSEDDRPGASNVEKRGKSDTPIGQAQAVSRPSHKSPKKKRRYAALKDIKDAKLPGYSQVQFSFDTRDAATSHSKQLRDKLKKHFLDSATVLSIPNTNVERENAAPQIFRARKDTSRAKDASSTDFNFRWADGAIKKYRDETLAAITWEIARLAERLHRGGPSTLSNRDPHYFPQIEASAHVTFKERLNVIVTLCVDWKACNIDVIKGTTLETTIAAPLEVLQSTINNDIVDEDLIAHVCTPRLRIHGRVRLPSLERRKIQSLPPVTQREQTMVRFIKKVAPRC
jgi:hypothetical protein